MSYEEIEDLGEIIKRFFDESQKTKKIKIEPNIMYKLECSKKKLQTGGKQKLFYSVYQAKDKRYLRKILEIQIPPNTKTNDYIIYKGLGNQVETSQEAGDLYVKICIYNKGSKRKGGLIKKVEEVKKVILKDPLSQEDIEIYIE